MESDVTLLSFVDVEKGVKALKCFAKVACDVTSSSGITDLTMVDHDVQPLMGALRTHASC